MAMDAQMAQAVNQLIGAQVGALRKEMEEQITTMKKALDVEFDTVRKQAGDSLKSVEETFKAADP